MVSYPIQNDHSSRVPQAIFNNGKALRDLQSRGAVGSEERSKWSQAVAEHQKLVIWHGPKTIKNQQPLGAMVKMLSYMD